MTKALSRRSRFLVNAALIILLYALYGVLNAQLELNLPAFGYRHAMKGFFLCWLVLFLVQKFHSSASFTALKVFTVVTCLSCLINFKTFGDLFDDIVCVCAPLSGFCIGSMVACSLANNDRIPIKILFATLVILEGVNIFAFLTDPLALAVHRDAVFCTIFLVPIVAFPRKKLFGLALFIVEVLIILFSIKRSAIIAVTFASAIYLFQILFFDKALSFKKKILIIFVVVPLIVGAVASYASNETFDKVMERIENMENDGGSGRDVIYANIVERIANSNDVQLLFGHGYDSVQEKFSLPAHNDLLEIAHDYGVISIIFWIFVILTIFMMPVKLIHQKKYQIGALLIATIFLWQMVSETNCIFLNSQYSSTIFIMLGLLISYSNKQINEKSISQGLDTLR